MHTFSYPEITRRFLDFEEKEDLLSLKIDGVYVWEAVRAAIYYRIIDHYISGNSSVKKNKIVDFKNLIYRVFINSLLFNPYFPIRESEILIFESGRKYSNGNKYIDIYTDYLNELLIKDKISFTRYEMNYNVDSPFFKRNFKWKHLDFILLLSKIKTKKTKCNFISNDLQMIQSISSRFEDIFGFSIDFKIIFEANIEKFKREYILFNKLFLKKKPKEIYLVNSCDKSGLILAAKDLGIIVNELQHGLNSNYDIVSNYPNTIPGDLHYFPDNFYIWDNVQMFFAKLPLSSQNIKYFKNKHIENWISKTKYTKKDTKTILIVSQPYGSDDIFNFILKNIQLLKDYNFIYKIHPVENSEKFINFKIENPHIHNLRFVMNEESIYELMKKSKYVIGVYSSALFEAIAFNCKVILLNLPGVEMSYSLLKNSENKITQIDCNLAESL